MKVYKVELIILDFDVLGEQGIVTEIENTRFANDCISPIVMDIAERDIGEWSDSHPLNNPWLVAGEYRKLFY